MKVKIKSVFAEEVDFSSFSQKEELCPEIFHPNSSIKKEVRSKLMKISHHFFDYLGFDWADVEISDIWLVGSLASFNWNSQYSDIDLHVLFDFSKVTEDELLLKESLKAMKELYNLKHNISIEGFPVELYAQDISEQVVSEGIFSVMRQTWVKRPQKRGDVRINKAKISMTVDHIENEIEDALSSFRMGDYDKASDMASDLKKLIRGIRKKGMKKGDVFSDENLIFKALRRNKSLEKLDRLNTLAFDKSVSIFSPLELGDEAPSAAPSKKAGYEKASVLPKPQKKEEEKGEKYSDGIMFTINGKQYNSLRDAEKETGIPKSTIKYRADSANFPNFVKHIQ
jgi:hypothetical protein